MKANWSIMGPGAMIRCFRAAFADTDTLIKSGVGELWCNINGHWLQFSFNYKVAEIEEYAVQPMSERG